MSAENGSKYHNFNTEGAFVCLSSEVLYRKENHSISILKMTVKLLWMQSKKIIKFPLKREARLGIDAGTGYYSYRIRTWDDKQTKAPSGLKLSYFKPIFISHVTCTINFTNLNFEKLICSKF